MRPLGYIDHMRQLAWIYHADVLADRPSKEVRDALERVLPGVEVMWVMPFAGDAEIGLRFHDKPEVSAFRAEDPRGWGWKKAFTEGPHHKSPARRKAKQGDRRRVRRAVRQALGGGSLVQPKETWRMPVHHGRPYIAPEDLEAARGDPGNETRSDDGT